jgi:hypothetical protein
MSLFTRLADGDRLALISQRVGFALWQLQELEGVTATYLVLVARAKKGMGASAGEALVAEAKSKTFGITIHDLRKAGKMPARLEASVTHLLAERNWLVHGSRASSRSAVRRDDACMALVDRIEAICAEAKALMKAFAALVEEFVVSEGVSIATTDTMAAKIIGEWRSGRAP